MITEWLLNLAAGFVAWLATLFPEWEGFESTFGQFAGFLSELMGAFVGLGVWVPWAVIAACVGVQITAWLLSLSGKTLRAVAAHIPFFGGAGD